MSTKCLPSGTALGAKNGLFNMPAMTEVPLSNPNEVAVTYNRNAGGADAQRPRVAVSEQPTTASGGHQSRHPGVNLGSRHGKAQETASVDVFGFWVFMMSDAVIFGLLFATFVAMRHSTGSGPQLAPLFDLKSVLIETMTLLASSVTFGMASLSLKYSETMRGLRVWLGITLLLGIVFLGLELHDFKTMIEQGGIPQRSGALSAFWGLVPLHGIHVTFASVWLISLLAQTWRFGLDDTLKVAILRLAVLWHFLDVIWVGIFTVVYVGAYS